MSTLHARAPRALRQENDMTTDAICPPYAGPGSGGVAVLPPGSALPDPCYRDDHRSLDCDLCGDGVDALWPLGPHHPPDDRRGCTSGAVLCVCRRSVAAIRPPAT